MYFIIHDYELNFSDLVVTHYISYDIWATTKLISIQFIIYDVKIIYLFTWKMTENKNLMSK